jgi:hypothetical protein
MLPVSLLMLVAMACLAIVGSISTFPGMWFSPGVSKQM